MPVTGLRIPCRRARAPRGGFGSWVGASMFKLADRHCIWYRGRVYYRYHLRYLSVSFTLFLALRGGNEMKVIGQTWQFENKPVIIGTGTIVGPEEGEGPLADDFDYIYDNIEINENMGKGGTETAGGCFKKSG